MANTTIQLKNSGITSNVPAALAFGEIALNYADGKLFYKAANNAIVPLGSQSNVFGTVNANGTLVVADSPSAILSIVAGNNVTIDGDVINDKITINAPVDYIYNAANAAQYTANLAFNMANTGNNFLGLNDTPSSYNTYANYFVVVNSTETGLTFTNNATFSDFQFTAQVAPATPPTDTMSMFVTASGTSPNRVVALNTLNQLGETVIISSVLT